MKLFGNFILRHAAKIAVFSMIVGKFSTNAVCRSIFHQPKLTDQMKEYIKSS